MSACIDRRRSENGISFLAPSARPEVECLWPDAGGCAMRRPAPKFARNQRTSPGPTVLLAGERFKPQFARSALTWPVWRQMGQHYQTDRTIDQVETALSAAASSAGREWGLE